MCEISVIIPIYNVEKYLNKCVDSVINQTYKNLEIILIDDGSTNNSPKICDEYSEKYDFIQVIHQQNKGLGGARNTGIYAAKGNYLLFLDSDDTIHEELLKICYDKIEKYDCDIVLFDLVATYEDGTLGAKHTNVPLSENFALSKEDLKPLAFLTGACNKIFKKELFINNNIEFPNKVWYEDLRTIGKFTPNVEKAYYYSEKPLYYYFQRSSSIMHTPDFNRIVTERIAAANEIWDYYLVNDYFEAYTDEVEFLMLYHGFFLPAREIQSMTKHFAKHIDALRENLNTHFYFPLQNKYISVLNRKEKMLLKWAYNRNYNMIKLFSFANNLYKKVKNVK